MNKIKQYTKSARHFAAGGWAILAIGSVIAVGFNALTIIILVLATMTNLDSHLND
jgi:hypothetical protein